MFRLIVLECLILACVVARHLPKFRDVVIDSGVVRGHKANDGEYFAFLGIPYAAPPLGHRRFKAPLPPISWDRIFHANRTVQCPQFGAGEEDCLILNVFTPARISDKPLPVIFYIHGGSFLMGSGQTKGVEPLIKENIITVTINYRLGALGFLCLGIDEAPGNAGLKDQTAALQWVQRNIIKFGGDSRYVTIYGMSAGGASVDLQGLSPLARGLFRNAIIESGVSTAVWAVDAKPIETALNFAKSQGYEHENMLTLINFYKRFATDKLSVSNNEYYQNLTDGTFGFAPCVENTLPDGKPFLTQSPYQILKNKTYTSIPMLLIFSDLEGLYLRSADYYELNYKDKMQNFQQFLPADLIFDSTEIRDQVAEDVKYFYFGHKVIGDDTLMEYLNYFGDTLVMHAILNSAITYSKDENDVYLMDFAYKGKLGSFDKFYENTSYAGHGDAVKHVVLNKLIENDEDQLAVTRMAKIIANFVKFSNPIPSRTDLLPVNWAAVKPDSVTYLRFDNDLQVQEKPHWTRKTFWDRLYDIYRLDNIKPVVADNKCCYS